MPNRYAQQRDLRLHVVPHGSVFRLEYRDQFDHPFGFVMDDERREADAPPLTYLLREEAEAACDAAQAAFKLLEGL